MQVELKAPVEGEDDYTAVFTCNQEEAYRLVLALQVVYGEYKADLDGSVRRYQVRKEELPLVKHISGGGLDTGELCLTATRKSEAYARKLVAHAIALLDEVRKEGGERDRNEFEDAMFLHQEASKVASMLFDIFENHDPETKAKIDAYIAL